MMNRTPSPTTLSARPWAGRTGPTADSAQADVLRWQATCRTRCGLTSVRIPHSRSEAWRLAEGRLAHETGRFFSITGLRATSNLPDLDGAEQPIIIQPEVGILGFLVRRSEHGSELLIQAKTEPGNVGAVQLAPTVQATVSNYTRAHGGAPTPYLNHFTTPSPNRIVADSLQSEQGTRFFDKYNRNVTVLVEGDGPEPVSDVWTWRPTPAVLALMHTDFCINTDARSALVCSPWPMLCGGRPFGRWQGRGGFGAALFESFNMAGEDAEALRTALAAMRNRVHLQTTLKPLDHLTGWIRDDYRITDVDEIHFEVPLYRITALDREVEAWDQPLVRSHGRSTVTLVCQRRQGILHFLLRGCAEIGFANKVQYGPTVQQSLSEPVARPGLALTGNGVVEHACCLQSDEGGRFDQSIVEYKIVEIPEGRAVPVDDYTQWATLRQIYTLLKSPGLITNEARTALSLLLPYL